MDIIVRRPFSDRKGIFELFDDYLYTKINELGYSRIWEHCQNGFFIISAYLNEEQYRDNVLGSFENYGENDLNLYNNEATIQLRKDLRTLGYGFIEQKGYYKNNIPEVSFFVPFNSMDDKINSKAFDDAIDLMQKYFQESILIYDKYSNDSGIYYLYNNGDVKYAGDFHKIEDINQYMSVIKNKKTGNSFYESIGIRTMRGHGSLCPYYQFLHEGYIPISEDFKN